MSLFGKKKEEKCCCEAGCTGCSAGVPTPQAGGLSVKVLGGGCAKCHALAAAAQEALRTLGMDTPVTLVTDYSQIAAYGVMSTPALVIDEKVVSMGKLLKADEIASLLQKRDD